MKLVLALMVMAYTSYAQEHCFEGCWTRAEKSGGSILQRNNQVIEHLVGCDAPDFLFESLSGETLTLRQLKGKVVVINFWFTTCPGCLVEMPALNRLVDEYFENSDVVFISFAKNTKDELVDFLGRHDFKYQHCLANDKLNWSYCILGWPMNIVLDKNGIVRYIRSGGPVAGTGHDDFPYVEMKPIIDQYAGRK